MTPRELNPIAKKLRKLIESGQTTLEKICVAADVKYFTLRNIFDRNSVSPMVIKSLKYAGIINDSEIKLYEDFLRQRQEKRKPRAE